MRASWSDVGRMLIGHGAASLLAGAAFAGVRTVLAIPSLPDVGAIILLIYLASVQSLIAGGAAAIGAVGASSMMPRLSGLLFPASGLLTAFVLAVGVDQVNLTFLVPAAAAGLTYGFVFHRAIWPRLTTAE